MKTIGVLLLITGLVVGVYVGLWWAFIGGIVDVVEAVRADELVAKDLATGVIKIIFAGPAGWIVGLCFAVPGYYLTQREPLK